MSAHTPGPWTFVRGGSAVLNDKAFDYPDTVRHKFIDEQGRCCTAFVATCDSTTLQNAANAQLIAAAPDLLAALKAIIRAYDGPTVDAANAVSSHIAGARVAIAKAEGGH